MSHRNPEDITFQVTVGQLTTSSQLPTENIHVTISVDNVSKITCPGDLSEDGLTVTWNHPFLFIASSFTMVRVAIWILPEKLTPEWHKHPFGNEVATSVALLLESGSVWKCDIPGLFDGPTTISLICRTCDVLITPVGHNCLSALQEIHWKLYSLGVNLKNLSCVLTQVELSLTRLDLCPLGHADHTNILNDFACALISLYDQEGNLADLYKAIEIQQIRLDLCPLGHSEHTAALGALTMALARLYVIQNNKKDLDKLIGMQQRWLDLCPPSHTYHTRALGALAMSLQNHYYVWGDVKDLNRAIEMEEQRLDLCPAGHPEHSIVLNSLASSLHTRYHEQGNITDLNKAIELTEEHLDLCPSNHDNHESALRNLAILLQYHYEELQNHSDLERAIMLLKKALDSCSVQHFRFLLIAAQLAQTTLCLYNSSQGSESPDQPLPSLDEVFEAYRLLEKCGPVASVGLLEATQSWVQNAEEYNHSSALEAYQASLNTLDHFTSLNSSLDSRHEAMQTRMAQDLANNAFSCATRHGNLHMAVELLEQGRGILWNQLARFDISIAVLEDDQGGELARRFIQLSTDLRKHAQQSGGTNEGADPYWRVQKEWHSVVDSIRHLDGFSRFLLPPRFEDLRRAAEGGPVIIVNASQYTCDALIVLNTETPVHVRLPCALCDVDQLCLQLSELTQDTHAYGEHRESYVKQMLRELWSSVVEPIASVLQNDIQLPLGSRIWWCPTSKFTVLPFHAAGPHRRGKKNFMDIYVSSYAPSLAALVRTRERIRVQREMRSASGTGNVISFAAIGQARPSVDVKLSELVEVEHEIQRIRNETNMPPNIEFEAISGGAATIEGAVQAFWDHRWIHVACHGAQHAEKPFDSWFAMGDGKLTLMRIIQERYINSEFAFLSACHTAVGDASTPDEVLHLAGGMQFAGFNGVIGTLWRVDDAVAHQVVTRFYKEMFKRPDVGFEHAAVALNTAVVETADEVSLEKRIVFAHIGI